MFGNHLNEIRKAVKSIFQKKKERKQRVFGKCLQINTWAPTPKMPHCFRNRFGEVPL